MSRAAAKKIDRDAAGLMRSPRSVGYRMPAEWEPHARTWIAWPHNVRDWPGKFPPIPWVFGEVVKKLAPAERVGIIVRDVAMQKSATRLLEKVGVALERIDFVRQATDRIWTRDTGPSFIRDAGGHVAAVAWAFNAWAKYDDFTRDRKLAGRIAASASAPVWHPRRPDGSTFVLEGGAIDVDGEGTLLCTEECLLDETQARNPGVSRLEQERILGDALGVDRVIWLGRGIAGDDTHGHIDDLARFVAPGRIVLCRERDPGDANYPILEENRERLQGARDAQGRAIEVIDLPMPRPLLFNDQRLPASYANFYLANDLVLVPTFNDPADRVALGILAELFPTRTIAGIHAVDLVWGLGTLHCMTQQEPRGE